MGKSFHEKVVDHKNGGTKRIDEEQRDGRASHQSSSRKQPRVSIPASFNPRYQQWQPTVQQAVSASPWAAMTPVSATDPRSRPTLRPTPEWPRSLTLACTRRATRPPT